MKDLKHKIEEFQFKEQLIQHEKVEKADEYVNFIKSLSDHPKNIKYVKPKDQTVFMIETALKGSKKSSFYDFTSLNYCNHKIMNESLIIELLPDSDLMNIIKTFLKHVPKHCLTNSFLRKLYENVL